MNFVKLTTLNDSIIYVNLDHAKIMARMPRDNYTAINMELEKDDICVKETPEEIMDTKAHKTQKVLE